MPKNSITTSKRGGRRTVDRSHRRNGTAANTARGSDGYIVQNGRTTHVLVPLEEYEELVKSSMVAAAIAKLEDNTTPWVDADELGLQLAGEKIAKARKAAGLTQKQLGAKLRIPQSQISRIERNPDHTTVKTLKRIAKALKVDVRALI